MAQPQYICIDLKSFYASVECVERGLDPLTTNLVVADETRTDKTICLAVSPSLKALGVPGRPRLFEVRQKLAELRAATGREVHFIIAPPQMAKYVACSAEICAVYLRYVAPEDMHVYSIDEVFIDISRYLKVYGLTAHEFAVRMVREVLRETGVTATVGIGTNLYLAKIAMDIVAKKAQPDADGVRLAELDEQSYRRLLWGHLPLTDFWRIGRGTRDRLARLGVYTMGDVARLSLQDEEVLFKEFGIDAELLIDHAWGIESCRMEDIKRFRPVTKSLNSGQVLSRPYAPAEARLIVREMTEALCLDLVDHGLRAEGLTLHLGYDREMVDKGLFTGETKTDYYGRQVPRSAHGTVSFGEPSSSTEKLLSAALGLFDEIMDRRLTVRHVNLTAIRLREAGEGCEQLDLFSDPEKEAREKELQQALLGLQRKFGKNAVLKGSDLLEGATARERGGQIGGHRA